MVKWTDHAKVQLRHIHDYIAQDSAIYAKRVTQALVSKSLQMDEFPLTGKVVAELKDESVREVSLYSYRILYEIKSDHLSDAGSDNGVNNGLKRSRSSKLLR